MHEYDFHDSARFFATASIGTLGSLAYEMNQRWPVFAGTIKALEADGLPGEEIDHLMEGVLIVWHATVKTAHLRLPKLTAADIELHAKHFAEFLIYRRGETEPKERQSLRFIQHPPLEAFIAERLREMYGEPARMPVHACALYFALMKCFDQTIAARERYCREYPSQ